MTAQIWQLIHELTFTELFKGLQLDEILDMQIGFINLIKVFLFLQNDSYQCKALVPPPKGANDTNRRNIASRQNTLSFGKAK
jgi:hypothetical protein